MSSTFPPTIPPVADNPASEPIYLAIEIGGSKLQLFTGTADGKILDRRRLTVDKAAGGEGIRAQIATECISLIEQWHPQAIGVGYGGPVDWRTGQIVKSYHIAGWNDFPLGDWLKKLTGLPSFVENDANTAALGEALCGAGRGASPVFYITVGSGVGGGLAVNGQIFHGASPGEVEIGHVRLDRDGTIVEARCSGWSLDRIVLGEIEKEGGSILASLVAEHGTAGAARHLGPAVQQGDPLAAQIIAQSTDWLALALSHVTHLLHPEVIVVGGGVSLIGEPYRAAIESTLPRFLMDAFQPGPRILLAELREDAVPIGALALASRRLHDLP